MSQALVVGDVGLALGAVGIFAFAVAATLLNEGRDRHRRK